MNCLFGGSWAGVDNINNSLYQYMYTSFMRFKVIADHVGQEKSPVIHNLMYAICMNQVP